VTTEVELIDDGKDVELIDDGNEVELIVYRSRYGMDFAEMGKGMIRETAAKLMEKDVGDVEVDVNVDAQDGSMKSQTCTVFGETMTAMVERTVSQSWTYSARQ